MPRIFCFNNPFGDDGNLSSIERLEQVFGTKSDKRNEKAKESISSKITGTGYILHSNANWERIEDYMKRITDNNATRKKGCWIKILNYRLKLENITYEELLKKFVIVSIYDNSVTFSLADKVDGNSLMITDNGLHYNNSILLIKLNLDLLDSELDFLNGTKKVRSIAIPVGAELFQDIDTVEIDPETVRAYTLEPYELYEQEPLAGVDYELYESLSERPEGFANDDPLYVLYQGDGFKWEVKTYRTIDVIQEMYEAGIVFAKKEYVERMIEFLTNFLPMSKGEYE